MSWRLFIFPVIRKSPKKPKQRKEPNLGALIGGFFLAMIILAIVFHWKTVLIVLGVLAALVIIFLIWKNYDLKRQEEEECGTDEGSAREQTDMAEFNILLARQNIEESMTKRMKQADECIKNILNTSDTDDFFLNWRSLECAVREMLLIEENPMRSEYPIKKYDDFVEDQRQSITKAFIDRKMREIEEIESLDQRDAAYRDFYQGLQPYMADLREADIEITTKNG